jgi:hypothetical protein
VVEVDVDWEQLFPDDLARAVLEPHAVIVRDSRLLDEREEIQPDIAVGALKHLAHKPLDQFVVGRDVVDAVVIHGELPTEGERSVGPVLAVSKGARELGCVEVTAGRFDSSTQRLDPAFLNREERTR